MLIVAGLNSGMLSFAYANEAKQFVTYKYSIYIGIAEWQTIVVLFTLLIVRRAGYRMIREPSTA